MKLKIKIKRFTDIKFPVIIDKGDWIDLRVATDVEFKAPSIENNKVVFDTKLLPLGVAMELPKGFEAQVLPRSSTPKLKVFQSNSEAVIDCSFNGNNDQWRGWLTALDNIKLNKGDRVFQFRIQLSQKATIWQKLKWLFSNGIELVEVDKLNDTNREGIGSTGIK